jgi:hypothetical protein
MPKGSKKRTSGTSTFHLCPCGFSIENASGKLIEMKKKLHRKICSEWKADDIAYYNFGVQLPVGSNQYNINKDKYPVVADIIKAHTYE